MNNQATKKAPAKEAFVGNISASGNGVKDFFNNLTETFAHAQALGHLKTKEDVRRCPDCGSKTHECSGEIDSDEVVYWDECVYCGWTEAL